MDELLNEIKVAYPDPDVNATLAAIPEDARGSSARARFTHTEELFLELDVPVVFPRFPIHHDIRVPKPTAAYARSLGDLVRQLASIAPEALRGTTYFFDPGEPLKPRFYRLYKVEESVYLFLLRLDIVYRHFQGEVLEPGTNDDTPAYRTRRLFVESELIPLDGVEWELGKARSFRVKQLVSNTWIGETGRGYLVHGIWMDTDLSKFFTKLVLPEGARTYPYYPLFCKYKTVCAQAAPPDPQHRRLLLPLLHRAVGFLGPEMERIQKALREGSFSESLEEFRDIRGRVPASWREALRGIGTRAYLNDRDMKEYALEYPDS